MESSNSIPSDKYEPNQEPISDDEIDGSTAKVSDNAANAEAGTKSGRMTDKLNKRAKRAKQKHESVTIPINDWLKFKQQNDEMLKLLRQKRKRIADDDSDSESSEDDDHVEPEYGVQNRNNDDVLQIEDNNDFDLDHELNLLAPLDRNVRNGNANVINEANDAADDNLADLVQDYNDNEGYGPAIRDTVARLAEKMARGMPDETLKRIEDNYLLPNNCRAICVPRVNSELWAELPRYAKIYDLRMQKVQKNLLKTAAVQIRHVETASNSNEMNHLRLAADALGLTLRNLRQLSGDRRVAIINSINPKFKRLNNTDIPITDLLFGNDLATHVKAIESSAKLGKGFGKSSKGNKYFPPALKDQSKNWKRNANGQPNYHQKLQTFAYRGRGRGRLNTTRTPRTQTMTQKLA